MRKVYSLFAGRHTLPENLGPICSDFNFETKECVQTNNWDQIIEYLYHGESVAIYVTGLTPALTSFLKEAYNYKNRCGTLTLLHFDAKTSEYWEQQMF